VQPPQAEQYWQLLEHSGYLYEMLQEELLQPKFEEQVEKSCASVKRLRSSPARQPECHLVNWYWAS